MVLDLAMWGGYAVLLVWLTIKGRGHNCLSSGSIGFGVQALAYVATYVSAVALVGFGGLAYAFGLQMLLVAAGNVWLGTWAVYRFLAWPTRRWQHRLEARTPAQLLGKGHHSPLLTRLLALMFAVFLGVYASAVIKGAAILLQDIVPLSLTALIWLVAVCVGLTILVGGLRGVLYTEALQGGIMLVGIVMLTVAVVAKVGGPVQGILDLVALPATPRANQGFGALSAGETGLFIISLVVVTSVAVWAQPQMIQRHFSLQSPEHMRRAMPVAMLVVTVVLGGCYFVAALSRLILPEISNLDTVMPTLVRNFLPRAGVQLFVLAVVSASVSTATALYHIAVSALAEDMTGGRVTRTGWALAIVTCVVVSAVCAQMKGTLIALLCTTSWSMVGGTVLVPYLALVLTGTRNATAAWWSVIAGFVATLGWYLCAYGPTALMPPLFGEMGRAMPPFFVGLALSGAGWFAGLVWARRQGVNAFVKTA